MDREQEPAQNGDDNHGNLLALAPLALLVGAVVGLLGAIFRLALQRADSLRDTFIAWAHGGAFAGFLFVKRSRQTSARTRRQTRPAIFFFAVE
jgi:chloride channel protein, CIC family